MRFFPLPQRRALAVLAAAGLALPLALGHAAAPPVAPSVDLDAADSASPLTVLAEGARLAPAAKLAPSLVTAAKAAPASSGYLVAYSTRRVDLTAYGKVLRQWTWPAGEVVTVVKAPLKAAVNIAAVPGVARVANGDPTQVNLPDFGEGPDGPPSRTRSTDPEHLAAIRAKVQSAPPYAVSAQRVADKAEQLRQTAAVDKPSGGIGPQGWFDLGLGHSTGEAWKLGYHGEGVNVAVLDTAIDFGHGDLQGTWAVLPPGFEGAGWPQQFDPFSTYLYLLETTDDQAPRYSQLGQSGLVDLSQESAVEERDINGQMVDSACFQPLYTAGGALELGDAACDFIVPESKSGHVRFGHHPDQFVFMLGQRADRDGEYAGVLLADPNQAGVYDTVYVDLDNDRDFTDEKPVTKDSPVAYRDLDGDGIADLSGGLLYFLADGHRPLPGAYLFEDEQTKLEVPAANTVVGFHSDWFGGEHGTMCASNVVSQGRLGVAPGTIIRFRNHEHDPALNADGEPEAVNPGMAPKAGLVAVGSVYQGGSLVMEAGWRYAVFGANRTRTEDDVQIASNSYGFSDVDADHWDSDSRFIDYYIRHYHDTLSFLVASGNGGPGYGTITAPKPATGMAIAASTQWGTLGQDSPYETSQVVFGDIVNWSDRGPAATGTAGISVASDGAFDAGAIPINIQTLDPDNTQTEARRTGEAANATFGGTSQATPLASGNLALVYQAFKQANGRWPTYEEARGIFMGAARFNGYDVATSGAGGVDTGNAVRMAAGTYGAYAQPSSWAAGDYHGTEHPGFAKLLAPGAASHRTITVKNPGATAVELTLKGQTLRRVGSIDQDWTSKDRSQESIFAIQAADYLMPLDKTKVPAGTDLMVLRVVQPYDQFDMNNNNTYDSADNPWIAMVYQHTDWNDDQKLWDDANGDGIVQKALVDPLTYVGLDAATVAVDYAKSEIQEGEYVRFDNSYHQLNGQLVSVHHPLERWKDGMYVALFHRGQCDYKKGTCGLRPATMPTTNLKIRLDFYKYEDWSWLSLSKKRLSVPAKGEATVDATLAVPANTGAGFYEGAVFADYARMAGDAQFPAGGGYELPGMRLTVPVTVDVAMDYDWQGSISLGGASRDADAPYDNGSLRGGGNWGWRPETGDWRFFFVDATTPPPGTQWIVKSTWQDSMPTKADIDSLLFGLDLDPFSDPHGAMADAGYYGPGTMRPIVASANAWLGADGRGGGRWAFDTSSGSDEDWIAGPAADGLHELMLHHVLFSGSQIDLPFETQLSSIRTSPGSVTLYGAGACSEVTLASQIALPGFEMLAAGLSKPVAIPDAPIVGTVQNNPASASFKREITTTGPVTQVHVKVLGKPVDDLDLYVLADMNADGVFTFPNELIGSSADGDSDEEVTIKVPLAFTKYAVWVHGFTVTTGTSTFDYDESFIYGDSLVLKDPPTTVEAGKSYRFQVCAAPGMSQDEAGPLSGIVALGPSGAKGLVTVNVTWLQTMPRLPIYLPFASMGYVLRPGLDPVPTGLGPSAADVRRNLSPLPTNR